MSDLVAVVLRHPVNHPVVVSAVIHVEDDEGSEQYHKDWLKRMAYKHVLEFRDNLVEYRNVKFTCVIGPLNTTFLKTNSESFEL